MKTLADFDWRGKTAVIRVDLNVPRTADGGVADDARLVAAAASVWAVLAGGGGCVVLSHLGRPKEGAVDPAYSLAPIAPAYAAALDCPVRFCPSLDDARAAAGEVLLLENTRFNAGEKANDSALARRYAALGDVFVMDAFASAHRAEASVAALADAGIPVCAGALLERELAMLRRVVDTIERPLVGVFGGAKISTKLALLRRMATLCDTLLVGGGMANTLLLARGQNIGASLAQRDMIEDAAAVLAAAGDRLLLPEDAIVAGAADDGSDAREATLAQLGAADKIFDIGNATRSRFAAALASARTILWNGPVGLFETPAYAGGSIALAQAIAASPAYSLIGGGDTITAARAAGALPQIDHISTGGGALLEYLAGDPLPGLAALAA